MSRRRRSSAWRAAAGLLLATTAAAQPPTEPAPTPPTEIGLQQLYSLCRPDRKARLDQTTVFRTLGVLRRTERLDAQGRVALIHPVAACCARGIAIGFCIRLADVTAFEDGTDVIVQGRLRPTDVEPDVSPGHAARFKLGLLRKHVEFEAFTVERYDRLTDDKLDDLTDSLGGSSYRRFAEILRRTGWDDTLRRPSYFTVLVPTDHAFAKLGDEQRRQLLAPEGAEAREELVRRHLIPAIRSKQDLISMPSVATLGDKAVPVELDNGKLKVGGARILFQDLSPRNGIILAIDRLLERPEPDQARQPGGGEPDEDALSR